MTVIPHPSRPRGLCNFQDRLSASIESDIDRAVTGVAAGLHGFANIIGDVDRGIAVDVLMRYQSILDGLARTAAAPFPSADDVHVLCEQLDGLSVALRSLTARSGSNNDSAVATLHDLHLRPATSCS